MTEKTELMAMARECRALARRTDGLRARRLLDVAATFERMADETDERPADDGRQEFAGASIPAPWLSQIKKDLLR